MTAEEPEKQQHQHKKWKGGDGPNFISRLLNKEVMITFRGDEICEMHGVLRGYNRYEILIEKEGRGKLVPKHAIDLIEYDGVLPDPLLPEPKPEEVKDGTASNDP